jgi:hypothetical protein
VNATSFSDAGFIIAPPLEKYQRGPFVEKKNKVVVKEGRLRPL